MRKAPARGRRHDLARAALVVLVLSAIGVLGWRLVRARAPRTVSVTRDAALERGLSALARQDDQAAEDWFRRGLAIAPDDLVLAVNLSVALNNKSVRVIPKRGVSSPVLATSRERIRAARECLRLYKEIEARLPPGMGMAHDRAQLYDYWGFPIEARLEYKEAQAIGDTTASSRDAVTRIVTRQMTPKDSPSQYVVR